MKIHCLLKSFMTIPLPSGGGLRILLLLDSVSLTTAHVCNGEKQISLPLVVCSSLSQVTLYGTWNRNLTKAQHVLFTISGFVSLEI